jgi:hypothetical protein
VIYTLQTNGHTPISGLSFYHPGHTKSNIPYTLARRICPIVTNQDLKKKRLDELEYFLQKQNFPKLLIKNGIQKASSKNIEDLRAPKHKTDDNVLPLVITHNPNDPQVIGKIRENFKFLNNSEKMKRELDKTKLNVRKRQPKNLKR